MWRIGAAKSGVRQKENASQLFCSSVKVCQVKTVVIQNVNWQNRAGKKPRSNCPGSVNFAPGQVNVEGWWSGGQVKLASVVLLVYKD